MCDSRLLLAAALLVVAPLHAQSSVHAGVASLAATHSRLDRLAGPVLQVTAGDPARRVRLLASLERVAGAQDVVRSPCGGMVRPGKDCTPVGFHDDGVITAGGLGPRVTLLRRTRAELAGFVMARVGVVKVTSAQLATAGGEPPRRSGESQMLYGGDVGACASWQPFARLPVAIAASYSVGGYGALNAEQVLDAEQPLDRGIRFGRAQVGLTWR